MNETGPVITYENIYIYSSLVPRPCPAFRHLQYGKVFVCGESLGTRLHK